MDTFSTSIATSQTRLDRADRVRLEDLSRLERNAQDVMATAMKLTDSWGQAMFIMEGSYVAALFSVLGFPKDVADAVYERVRNLAYVNHKIEIANQPSRAEFTWHVTDAACLTLRGAVGLGQAMSSVNDNNIENTLLARLTPQTNEACRSTRRGAPTWCRRCPRVVQDRRRNAVD